MDFAEKLRALEAEQERLAKEREQLKSARIAELGQLAEKCGLFNIDNKTLAGAFLEIAEELAKEGSARKKGWAEKGATFLAPGPRRGRKPRAAKSPPQNDPAGATGTKKTAASDGSSQG